jgi:hypothetical protein
VHATYHGRMRTVDGDDHGGRGEERGIVLYCTVVEIADRAEVSAKEIR